MDLIIRLSFISSFKQIHISKQISFHNYISNFRTKFLEASMKFHLLVTPRHNYNSWTSFLKSGTPETSPVIYSVHKISLEVVSWNYPIFLLIYSNHRYEDSDIVKKGFGSWSYWPRLSNKQHLVPAITSSPLAVVPMVAQAICPDEVDKVGHLQNSQLSYDFSLTLTHLQQLQ